MTTLMIVSDRRGARDGGFYRYRIVSQRRVVRSGRIERFENCRTVEDLVIEVAKELIHIKEEKTIQDG